MGKFIRNKELSKIAKGTLAVVLAGTFTFTATNAFAEGIASQTPQPVVAADANVALATAPTKESSNMPSLLPGDFFYFAKMIAEKIELALTFDKVKDAKLLANFASERLAEAEALFTAGKQTEALDTIQAAINDINRADKIVGDSASTLNTSEEQTSANANGQATGTDSTLAGAEQVKLEDQTAADGKTSSESGNDDRAIKQVKVLLARNIDVLTAALQKVQNPTAKAALQKNIEKNYLKLANKIKMHEEKLAEKTENQERQIEADKNTAANKAAVPTSNANVKAEITAGTEAATTSNTVKADATAGQSEMVQSQPITSSKSVQGKAQVSTIATLAPVPAKKDREQAKQQIKQEVKEVHQQVVKTAKQDSKQIQQAVNEQLNEKHVEVKLFFNEKKDNEKEKNRE